MSRRLEDRLAVRVEAVPGAQPGVLARQVEGGEGLPGRQQVIGPHVMGVERVHLRALLQVAGLQVDGLEQSLPVVHASRADVVGEAEVADVVVGQARVVVDGERVERRPEPAGPLAVARLDEPGGAVGADRAHLDERRQGGPLASPVLTRQDRAIVGPVVGQGAAAADDRDRPAGEQLVRGRRVVDVAVVDRAEDRQPSRLAGEPGEVLGDEDPRHLRRDRPELAPEAVGGVGLQVPRLLLRGAPPHEQDDARLGPTERPPGPTGGHLPGLQQRRQPQAEQPQPPGPQELATRTVLRHPERRTSFDRMHDSTLLARGIAQPLSIILHRGSRLNPLGCGSGPGWYLRRRIARSPNRPGQRLKRFAPFLTAPWELSEWQVDDPNSPSQQTHHQALSRGSGWSYRCCSRWSGCTTSALDATPPGIDSSSMISTWPCF